MNPAVSQAPSFNLIDEAWIPCIDLTGKRHEMSLLSVLAEAHLMREIVGESPPVTVALHRLLLAILHRIFGPNDYEDWDSIWSAEHFDNERLAQYCLEKHDRFDLFHAKIPFYQDASLSRKPKSISALILDVASGDNSTLFDHHTDEDDMLMTPAQAARSLVAIQNFGLSGTNGKTENFSRGLCASGAIFILQGESLFETLMLNLIRYPDPSVIPTSKRDLPCWEMDDPFQPSRETPLGYLDYLTWQNRRVKLLPKKTDNVLLVSQIYMAPGLVIASNQLDPMKLYTKSKKGELGVVSFSEKRLLWRDSTALFRLRNDEFRPPRSMDWLAEIQYYFLEGGRVEILNASQLKRVSAYGLAISPEPGKAAKIDFYRSEQMPLPLAYLNNPNLLEYLTAGLFVATSVSLCIQYAAETLATYLVDPDRKPMEKKKLSKGQQHDVKQICLNWDLQSSYWSQLEVPYFALMELLTIKGEMALAEWYALLRRTAVDSLTRAIGKVENSPRGYKAAVQARQQLASGLAKALPAKEAVTG